MATKSLSKKKTTKKVSSPRKKAVSQSHSSPRKKASVKSFFNRFKASPVTMYVGGGIATIMLFRWARRYYKGHPEIKEFLRDNLDTVEDKFREYKDTVADLSERH